MLPLSYLHTGIRRDVKCEKGAIFSSAEFELHLRSGKECSDHLEDVCVAPHGVVESGSID